MLIENINLNTYKQDFTVDEEIRKQYGEIYTPFSLIEKMFDNIPKKIFCNPNLKWLDIGAGSGYFSIFLFDKLYNNLKDKIEDDNERRKHIIENMLYMVDIREENILKLKSTFGNNCNAFFCDFLSTNIPITFDFIIGNPPYNNNGIKKVPTNNKIKKTKDGNTLWFSFIKKSISLLKKNGKLSVIIPSIWMKPDKVRSYHYLTQYKIEKVHCFTNTETNKIFNKMAQTPTCYFLLTKTSSNGIITLYDKISNDYVPYELKSEIPIPLMGQSIINKILTHTEKVGCLKVFKTNLPSKTSKISNIQNDSYPYENIHTCLLKNNEPELSIKYSNKPQCYYNVQKLVMAHKMYGFPYLDTSGNYGISNRDNYVIIDKSYNDLIKIKEFLSTEFALYLFETTRYRMMYLEKYIFELLPDITKLEDFPSIITNQTIMDYFNLTPEEQNTIQTYYKKKYKFFK